MLTNEGKKPNRLKGMKLRDEFVCPITFEIMSDPVVASDGHTYEKAAIEKWFKTSLKSPRSGETLTKNVISNLNMKKLIQDLIHEGGNGLYVIDIADKSRMFDVYPEKIINLKCLGPPESDWNGQAFQVTPYGCVGGRKVIEVPAGREIVAFRDSTVSRKHFEVTCDATTRKYQIRDVGSAGGTFIRIPFGERRELHPGMMLLIGKHQFTVSSIDSTSHTTGSANGNHHTPGLDSNCDTLKLNNGNIIDSLVKDADDLIQSLSTDEKQQQSGSGTGNPAIDQRLILLSSKMNHLKMMNHPSGAGGAGGTSNSNSNSSSHVLNNSDSKSDSPQRKRQNIGMSSKAGGDTEYDMDICNHESHLNADADFDADFDADAKHGTCSPETGLNSPNSSKKCTITCFAPDGSPLQGHSFIVDVDGAAIGRKLGCKIPLYITQDIEEDKSVLEFPAPQEQKVINIDTAVSSEHARIELDEVSGKFYVLDGTLSKPSTNGTWIRLSGPSQESPYTTLNTSTELLIGTVRFSVSETMTILEKVVTNTSTNSSTHNTPSVVKIVDEL